LSSRTFPSNATVSRFGKRPPSSKPSATPTRTPTDGTIGTSPETVVVCEGPVVDVVVLLKLNP